MNNAQVIGVGMVPFAKPGKQEPYKQMAGKAIRNALADASIDLADVQQAYASYVYGDSTCGQTALYGAAVLVASSAFAKKHGIGNSITIRAQTMATDRPQSFTSAIDLVGADMTRNASRAAYEQAGVGPEDFDVVELHDCFTPNEVITYEALGLCDKGDAEAFINKGGNTYGGKYVVNPSGGLMSKGHPLGATGLAQCSELVWQLRGQAGARQVEGARLALQHNLRLGGGGGGDDLRELGRFIASIRELPYRMSRQQRLPRSGVP